MLASEARIAKHLGDQVRQGRQALGWTQETLAERLGLTAHYVSMIERGQRLPSYGVLVQLAELLGKTLAQLIGESGLEPWVEEALTLLMAAPPRSREIVLAMLRGVVALPAEPAVEPRRSSGRRPHT